MYTFFKYIFPSLFAFFPSFFSQLCYWKLKKQLNKQKHQANSTWLFFPIQKNQRANILFVLRCSSSAWVVFAQSYDFDSLLVQYELSEFNAFVATFVVRFLSTTFTCQEDRVCSILSIRLSILKCCNVHSVSLLICTITSDLYASESAIFQFKEH